MVEGLEIERRRPGIVDGDARPAGMGDLGYRRHILHLEGLRTRRLQIDQLRLRAHQLRDAGADGGVEEGGSDAVARQRLGGVAPGRSIDAVRHQHMVAGRQHGGIAERDRRHAGGTDDRAFRALDLRHRVLQGEHGGGAAPPVGRVARTLRREPLGDRAAKDRRSVEDRRVDHAEKVMRVAPRMRQDRVRPLSLGHVSTGVSSRDPHSLHEPS